MQSEAPRVFGVPLTLCCTVATCREAAASFSKVSGDRTPAPLIGVKQARVSQASGVGATRAEICLRLLASKSEFSLYFFIKHAVRDLVAILQSHGLFFTFEESRPTATCSWYCTLVDASPQLLEIPERLDTDPPTTEQGAEAR